MRIKTTLLLTALLGFNIAAPVQAEPLDLPKLTTQVQKSLVFVEYTYKTEISSNEGSGQGIILNKEGVVLVSGNLFPEQFTQDYIKNIKIRLPQKNFTTVPAKFLGRTQDRVFAFIKADIKADTPIAGEPLDFSKTGGDIKLGQEVASVGLMSKGAGWGTALGESKVKFHVLLNNDVAATASWGLTRPTSPVYDEATGNLVGITFPSAGETMELLIPGVLPPHAVILNDEEQDSLFVLYDDIKHDLENIPTEKFESPRPWMGLDGVTGLDEDMKTLYGIDQPAGVTVGSVIPNQAADEAGVKDKDVVLSVNGKSFSDSVVPELMALHFERVLGRMKIGDTVTLGVLRDGKKMDIPVKLRPSPKLASQMPHVYDAKLGITYRDLVFTDAYARKLPQEQKGVMVGLIKPGSLASLGATPLHPNDLITKINGDVVNNQEQLADKLKQAEAEEGKEIIFVVIRPNRETAVCRIDMSGNPQSSTDNPNTPKFSYPEDK